MRLFGYPYSLIRFLAKVDGATKYRRDPTCKRRGFDCIREYQKIKLTMFFKKKYRKYIGELKRDTEQNYGGLSHENCGKVWVCWLQGLENAPEIVKLCCKSIADNVGADREVVFIDKENYKNYVTLPDYILKKYNDGIIADANFSDILRLELLIKYGGTWIDSTILLTGKPERFMLESPLFMPCTSMWETYQIAFRTENYFITADSNDKILTMTLKLLYKYWQSYNICVEYLLVYVFTEIAIEQFSDEWSRVCPFPRANINLMQEWLERPFDSSVYDQICRLSRVHKLTYKLPESCIKDGNNFYNHIVGSLSNR